MSISFAQLATGTPPDIEVTTDDADGELAALEEIFEAGEFEESAANLEGTEKGEDGKATFVIPGSEAADVSDVYMPLADFIEECNAKAVERAHAIADEVGGDADN